MEKFKSGVIPALEMALNGCTWVGSIFVIEMGHLRASCDLVTNFNTNSKE